MMHEIKQLFYNCYALVLNNSIILWVRSNNSVFRKPALCLDILRLFLGHFTGI
jgi:hypothetical protein